MTEQVKVTINPHDATDYRKAAELEKFVDQQLELARADHRLGKHAEWVGICQICLELEEP